MMSTEGKELGTVRYAGVCEDCDRTVEKRFQATAGRINNPSGTRVRCKECGEIVLCQKNI